MSRDANDRSHTSEGQPGGGQYETEAKRSTGPSLTRAPDPSISDLGLEPGDSHYMSAYEAGTDIFTSVEIIRDDEGNYRAEGAMLVDFVDVYTELTRFCETIPAGPSTDPTENAETYLNDNAQLVESFLKDRYGLEVDGGADSWAEQTVSFTTDLKSAVDTVGSVAYRLENATKAIELYNESDAGTFDSPYVWRELAERIDAWEDEVDDARRQFAADVFSDQGLDAIGSDHKAARSASEDLDAAGATVVRAFMADHFDAIEQAKKYHQEAYGIPYETVGRDLSLAVHNPSDTPHGRLAFSAFPPEIQARLQKAARAYSN